eukprot:gene9806-20396_t
MINQIKNHSASYSNKYSNKTLAADNMFPNKQFRPNYENVITAQSTDHSVVTTPANTTITLNKTKHKKISPKSLLIFKRNISASNDTIRNTHSSEVAIDQFNIDYYERQYAAAIKAAGEWECSLYARYSEKNIVSIMGMYSYLDNIELGFGHLNDENLFNSERRADISGRLYKEATLRSSFSKIYLRLRRPLKFYKLARAKK